MKTRIYIPPKNSEHIEVLRALAKGIPGAMVRSLDSYEDCDIAVVYGLYKQFYKKTRDKIPVLALHNGRSLIVVEQGLVRRGEYYTVGFGGVNGNGDFRRECAKTDRFHKLDMPVRPWSTKPDGPVVVCGQVMRDVAVQHHDHASWCRRTFNYYTDRNVPVVFRPHPLEKYPRTYGIDAEHWDTFPLHDTLARARCVVTFNSNIGVDAVLFGCPTIAENIGAYCWPVADHDLDAYANPRRPVIDRWVHELAYSQWTVDEMAAGKPWAHLTKGLTDSEEVEGTAQAGSEAPRFKTEDTFSGISAPVRIRRP